MRTGGLQTAIGQGRAVRAVALGLACLLLSRANVGAQPVTINFENFSGMRFDAGFPVPASSQLSNQLLLSQGLSFRSESTPYVAVVNLGVGHATSGTNGIGGVNASGQLSYSTPIRVEFVLPGSPGTPAVTDSVSIRNDLSANGGEPVTLEAFDIAGRLVGSATMIDDHVFTLSVSVPGIHSVRISEGQSLGAAAFDDFSFNGPLVAVSAVLDWFSLAGGGGKSTGGVYTARATLGEPTAGASQGGGYSAAVGFWPSVAASQPPLQVSYAAGMVTVSWPKPATDFLLDQSPNLNSPVPWSQVAFPYETNTARIYITVPTPIGNRFYRLRQP